MNYNKKLAITFGPALKFVKLRQTDRMNFVVAILAHKPIATFTPFYLKARITRVTCRHTIFIHVVSMISFYYSLHFLKDNITINKPTTMISIPESISDIRSAIKFGVLNLECKPLLV
jgi:hypothetical protein